MGNFIKSFLPSYFVPGTKKLRPSKWIALGFFIILFFVPLHKLATGNTWVVKLVIKANIFAIFAISWDILSGYTGQENFGHHFFIGVGSFFVGLLTVALVKSANIDGTALSAVISFKLPPVVIIILAGISSAIFGLLIGIPCLKLAGPYLALATLAMGLIFHEFVDKILPEFSPVIKQHTTEGIRDIPSLASLDAFYYILLIVLLVSLFVIYSYSRSHYGLVLKAIKKDEPAAKAMGINTTFYKVSIFTGSAFFAGLAGAFYAYFLGTISPDSVESHLTLKIISMCIVGGMGTVSGSFGGAYFLIFMLEIMSQLARGISELTGAYGIREAFKVFEDIFYYGVIILVMLFMPKGIVTTSIKKITDRYNKKKGIGVQEDEVKS